MKQVFHNIIEIKKCIIGEKNLTPNSLLPKQYVENEINQAIKGGLEKYPNCKLLDQSQYWASSTDNSNGEWFKINSLKIVKDNKIKTIILEL